MVQTASGLAGRLIVRISPADAGRRVTVRHRVPGERSTLTDVVGVLDAWTGGRSGTLVVRRRDGRLTRVPAADMVAARVVPPEVSAFALQHIAQHGWPPLESVQRGEWELRWSGGGSGRSNSVRVGGPVPGDLPRVLAEVSAWYATRGGRAQLQVPDPSDLDEELAAAGWRITRRTLMLATALPRLRTATAEAADRSDIGIALEPRPTAGWLGTLSDADEPGALVPILTAPTTVCFCELRSRTTGELLAIGRGSVHQGWLGVTSVETVAPARRIGLARTVMAALAAWGQEQGADRCYLQVFATNTPALALYDRLGFAKHHAYVYRGAP